MVNGLFVRSEEGTPQGGPLSPLLSNVMLNELDKELERRGLPFVRYADDSMIFCRSKRAARRVRESITNFIEGRLHQKVNKEKTVVCYVRGVKYLGYSFYINKGKCLLTVHPKTKAKMRHRLKELTCRSNGMGYAKRKKTPPLHKGLGELLSPCHYEETDRENRRVVTATLAYVYMEVMEASQDPNQEPR